jgi:hypothetical protein
VADGEDGNLNEKDRIGIMLEEYKALRAETVARTTMQAQINYALGAGAITVIGLVVVYHKLMAGIVMVVILLILSFLVSNSFPPCFLGDILQDF